MDKGIHPVGFLPAQRHVSSAESESDPAFGRIRVKAIPRRYWAARGGGGGLGHFLGWWIPARSLIQMVEAGGFMRWPEHSVIRVVNFGRCSGSWTVQLKYRAKNGRRSDGGWGNGRALRPSRGMIHCTYRGMVKRISRSKKRREINNTCFLCATASLANGQ